MNNAIMAQQATGIDCCINVPNQLNREFQEGGVRTTRIAGGIQLEVARRRPQAMEVLTRAISSEKYQEPASNPLP